MADAKITELTELTSVESTDLIAVVDDPSGSPVTKKATVSNLTAAKAPIASPTFTGTVTLPAVEIQDTSADHQYVLAVSELTADRTVTLPLLTGNDEFVFKDHAQTLTNKTLSTGSKLDANADSNFTFNSLARQAIINGNFDVWQRNTTIAMTTANAYTADRWYCETATAGTDKTVSREDGTGVNGSYYCARVKMVSDVDELLTFSQALESQDSIKFRGQKVTLSFYARGGAEFVADNATLVSKIVTGKGTDQKVLAFTTSADGVSQNNTLTTGWQKFTCTTTNVIASDITQIGVSFAFTHAGSGTTTNYFEITQVQLCAGDVALPFMPKSYEEELRACQRYYEKSYNYTTIPGTATDTGSFISKSIDTYDLYNNIITMAVLKRTTPTITWYNTSTGGSASWRNRTDSSNLSTNANGSSISEKSFWLSQNNILTANKNYSFHWTADAEL